MAKTRIKRRYERTRPRSNPPLFRDVLEFAGPGFGSFAATRFLTRITMTALGKRNVTLGKHGGVAISAAAFLALWFLGHKVKWLEKYHTPIVVGSFIATAQTIIQTYVPQLGWMISDASPELAAVANTQAQSQLAAQTLPRLRETNEDPEDFVYDDSFDAGRQSDLPKVAGQDIDTSMEDAVGQATNMGVFQN